MNRLLNPGLWAAGLMVFAVSAMAAEPRVKMVNEGGIRDQWTLADGAKLAAPGYPAQFAERGDNVCIAMGYAIKPDGSTSDFGLLKAWSSSTGEKEPADGFWDAFAQTSAGALSQWKFKPRPEVTAPETTYTVATLHFMGKEATDVAALRGHCAISDLASFVQQKKWNAYQTGTLEKKALENFQRSQRAARSMRESPTVARPIR